MDKKWIIIGVIVIIMIMTNAEKVEKKESGIPKYVKDITSIETNIVGLGTNPDNGYPTCGFSLGTSQELAQVWFRPNMVWEDLVEFGTTGILTIDCWSEEGDISLNIKQGDYFRIGYKTGAGLQAPITIYLPATLLSPPMGHLKVYVKDSLYNRPHETYYDAAITQPACTFANRCLSPTPYYMLGDYTYYYLTSSDNFQTFITNANGWAA